MKKLVGLILSTFIIVSSSFSAEVIEGKVISVIDGNTIQLVTTDQQTYKIALAGIDCPELGQEYGDLAKSFLEKLILNKSVTATIQGKDRWGHSWGVVKIKGNRDPRIDLLKEGLAWTVETNPDPDLDSHKSKAQQKGLGLWQVNNPTPPWTYRRQQTMVDPKSL